MTQERILLVDDEEEIIAFMKDALEREGYQVFTAANGREALELSQLQPELILLDVMMPELDGFETCRRLREFTQCPIVFLSACQSETDRIQGLAAGGDDYLLKPFSLAELKARIHAHLRREKRGLTPQDQSVLRFHSLTIDCKGYTVNGNGQDISLTNKEFKIVELLAMHPGQVFTREQIYEKLWGWDAEGDDATVTEHIKKIRAKFAACIPDRTYIQTVWGIGYKWEVK
ncbi:MULTISPECIES: response regulator transcription factor [Paenibacillus]|uniref:Response regulator n=1 Tax=Paenibacillus campinasensis TaxID=66347 RepID=A0A268F0U1_9BACL|nr:MULTISPECIES: response regulator transcription factor [Paenibacillus]MUG65662.1 response regulator [Paenibacillus campinasensis]PAD78954.1 DNA-binding response regulator [Paenibacillus campinasensis]PAK54294.1 DNA-binding response regulator [Paenibacillus sp. 7541]